MKSDIIWKNGSWGIDNSGNFRCMFMMRAQSTRSAGESVESAESEVCVESGAVVGSETFGRYLWFAGSKVVVESEGTSAGCSIRVLEFNLSLKTTLSGLSMISSVAKSL